MSSIDVNPAIDAGAVAVNTDEVDNVHTPVYKSSFSAEGDAPVHVSTENPLPTANTASQLHAFSRQDDLLEEVVLQLKILNKYMSVAQDETFTKEDLEE